MHTPDVAPALVSPPTIHDMVSSAIREAVGSSDLSVVVIARADGVAIAHNLAGNPEAKKVAAMGAAVVGISTMAAVQLASGNFREVLIQTDGDRLAFLSAGDHAIVAGVFPERSNLEFILTVLHRLADRVGDAIRAAESP